MTTRTKSFVALAAIVLLVVVQGLVDVYYAAKTQPATPMMVGWMVCTALAVLALGGLLAKMFWLPVARLARTAREVSAGKPIERLPLQSPDEFRDLAAAFNHLLDTLQNSANSRKDLEESLREQTRELEQRLAGLTLEVRAREQRLQTLLANLPGMVCRRRNDRDWTLEYVNGGCRDLLGVAPEDLTTGSIPFIEWIHPEDRERVWFEVQTALAVPGGFTLAYRVKHTAGEWRSVAEKGWAILDQQGRVTALEGQISDLTLQVEEERKCRRMEDQLRRAQKMETIGTLAGGVAHNFNNVLAGILGSAELIKMDLEPEHPSREFLDHIFLAGRRAREVVQQVLTFSQWREDERIILQL